MPSDPKQTLQEPLQETPDRPETPEAQQRPGGPAAADLQDRQKPPLSPQEQADDERWMAYALQLAERAEALDEVPVGAVVVRDGEVLGEGWNCPISGQDPTAHAEVRALRDAAQRIGNYRLSGATLYVTLEPCTMCAGALVHARIQRVVFGAWEPKAGAVGSTVNVLENPHLNYRVAYRGGVSGEACSSRLSDFFRRRREEKKRAKQRLRLDCC